MNAFHAPLEELQSSGEFVLSRLIVVSNREPYEHRLVKNHLIWEKISGGLISALDPVMRRLGGTWITWGSGKADRNVVDETMVVEVPPDAPIYRLRRVWLDANEVKGGYQGYANQVLWPLCHLTLDRVAYRKVFWHSYQAMNARFAETVLDEIRTKPGFVWVHDFHLALLAGLLKASLPQQPVATFWHTPWPGPDAFRILPERRELIESLLADDLVMFQTRTFLHAFVECAKEFLGPDLHADDQRIDYKGHRTRLVADRSASGSKPGPNGHSPRKSGGRRRSCATCTCFTPTRRSASASIASITPRDCSNDFGLSTRFSAAPSVSR